MKVTLHPDRTLTLELSWEEWPYLPDGEVDFAYLELRQEQALRLFLGGLWRVEGIAELIAGPRSNAAAGETPGDGADVDPHAGHTGPAGGSGRV